MYFPTMLSCCGILPARNESSVGHNSVVGEVVFRQQTYVRWIHPDLNDYSGTNKMVDRPLIFEIFDLSLIHQGRGNGCIFARKYIPKHSSKIVTVREWETLVE